MIRARNIAAIVATALVVGAGLVASWPGTASAQGNVNPGRDCQTVRTCNFAKNGAVRGCLSTYTCRTCKLVPAKCDVGGRKKCQEFVCSWGG